MGEQYSGGQYRRDPGGSMFEKIIDSAVELSWSTRVMRRGVLQLENRRSN